MITGNSWDRGAGTCFAAPFPGLGAMDSAIHRKGQERPQRVPTAESCRVTEFFRRCARNSAAAEAAWLQVGGVVEGAEHGGAVVEAVDVAERGHL